MSDALQFTVAFLLAAIPAVVFLLPAWWRAQERKALLRLAAAALEQNQPLSTETLLALPGGGSETDSTRDIRRGAILIAIGGGLLLIGLLAAGVMAAFDPRTALATGCFIGAFGVLPASIGVAFTMLGRMQKRSEAL